MYEKCLYRIRMVKMSAFDIFKRSEVGRRKRLLDREEASGVHEGMIESWNESKAQRSAQKKEQPSQRSVFLQPVLPMQKIFDEKLYELQDFTEAHNGISALRQEKEHMKKIGYSGRIVVGKDKRYDAPFYMLYVRKSVATRKTKVKTRHTKQAMQSEGSWFM